MRHRRRLLVGTEWAALVFWLVGVGIAVTAVLSPWLEVHLYLSDSPVTRTLDLRPYHLGYSGWMWLCDVVLLAAAVLVALFSRGRLRAGARIVGALLVFWSVLDVVLTWLRETEVMLHERDIAFPPGPLTVTASVRLESGLGNAAVAVLVLGLAVALARRSEFF